MNFNFSLIFVGLALSFGLKRLMKNRVKIVALASMLIWFAAMQSRPHKEERFLFVIYPCICLLSSHGLHLLPSKILKKISILVIVLISTSRWIRMISGYGAPFALYSTIPEDQSRKFCCVSAEWYRFPSSYFLPSNVSR